MNKITQKKIIIILLIITLSLATVIVASGFAVRSKVEEPDVWVLHSYGNNVALYNGENIIEVYGSIALDTLPKADRQMLDKGIAFHSKEEARSAIEDYDG